MTGERDASIGCGTCVHWREANDGNWCSRLIVLTKRERFGGREAGEVMPVEAVPTLRHGAEWRHVRTLEHGLCEQWRSHDNRTLLDPIRFPQASQHLRLERGLLIDRETARRAVALQRRQRDGVVEEENAVTADRRRYVLRAA